MQQQGVENLPAAVWLLPLQYPAHPLAPRQELAVFMLAELGHALWHAQQGPLAIFFPNSAPDTLT